jgi:hypothetical protein
MSPLVQRFVHFEATETKSVVSLGIPALPYLNQKMQLIWLAALGTVK